MPIQRLTAADLVRAINYLPRDFRYYYVNPRTRTVLNIQDVVLPEGPITIKRWDPSKGETEQQAAQTSISTEMIARVADAFLPNHPINFDRVLGASYNTRSALEALLAYTPEFYACYPGRIDSYTGNVKEGHKHLMWIPDDPHAIGEIAVRETGIVISEATVESTYDALEIPDYLLQNEVDIEAARQHVRMQIAIILIGQCLGYKTWVAANDQGITYGSKRLVEMETVIRSLAEQPLLHAFPDAQRAGSLIDCIWFANDNRYMPAVMEIEHSTGVTSGLTRMKGFKELIPSIRTNYVIIAPDEQRKSVVEKANRPQFRELDTYFFSYSAVAELYHLCQRRQLRGVTHEFIMSFMEYVIE